MPFKIYVDSRFRQETGGNNSDAEFSIELPHPLQIKGRAFVDVVALANAFYTIRAGENDRVHVGESASHVGTYRIVTIAEGQYNAVSLGAALLTALNGSGRTIGLYTVAFNTLTSKLEISNEDASNTFQIYPAAWLRANTATWNSSATSANQVDPKNLRDAGSVIGFTQAELLLQTAAQATVIAPDVVNTQPYHQLFLRSSLGDGYSAIGPDGSSDIIRRITVQVPLNDIVVDMHGLPHDSVPVGNREITSLAFRLTDADGRTVDTKGHHVSFSIIFLTEE